MMAVMNVGNPAAKNKKRSLVDHEQMKIYEMRQSNTTTGQTSLRDEESTEQRVSQDPTNRLFS